MTAVGSTGKEKSVTAQNQFTDNLFVRFRERASISISGTWTATVTLQRSFDQGSTWFDVDPEVPWTANIQTSFVCDEDCHIRLGVKTGNFTSGPVECRIGTS